jgi:disulfide bond formation protein DsbB
MTDARLAPLVILVASAAVVGGALLLQYVGGLQPCELCLYQRWPYYAAVVATLIALALGRRGVSAAVIALCGAGFLVGVGLAFYHVGVEQHWFAGPAACTGGPSGSGSLADFKAQLLAQPVARCDVPQWSLFGVTLAGWNLIASAALVVFCVLALRRTGPRGRTA